MKNGLYVVATLIISGALCFGCTRSDSPRSRREQESLAKSAAPVPGIVRLLAKGPHDEVIASLIQVAEAQDAAIENRTTALEELSKFVDQKVGDSVARLVAPHQPFLLRQAALSTIQRAGCGIDCDLWLLQYLYRYWAGESNALETSDDPKLQASYRKDEENLAGAVLAILANNEHVLQALELGYGLGSEQPSEFGLRIVERTSLKSACRALFQSFSKQQMLQKLGQGDSRKTEATIRAVGCPALTF
jgi:hypothetical protein